MGKIYYISDLHLFHANIIWLDKRPFDNVEEMNQTIIDNWNRKVKDNDTVYILGDFIWLKQNEWLPIVKLLKGQKILIKGNHDPIQYNSELKKCFADITNLTEIIDNDKNVVLCHYPIPFPRHCYNENTYMLYGHVHATREYMLIEKLRKEMKETSDLPGHSKGNLINVGAMMPWMDYTPQTLDEIIQKEKTFYKKNPDFIFANI